MNFLEKGTYGSVFLAYLPQFNKNYAIKCINKDNLIRDNYIDRAKLEINIMSKISHPFIVQMHFMF